MSTLDKLKNKARQLYLDYFRIYRLNNFTCGHELAQVIHHPLSKKAQAFNTVMGQIRVMDSAAPKYKL